VSTLALPISLPLPLSPLSPAIIDSRDEAERDVAGEREVAGEKECAGEEEKEGT
jgi:hypothetical protein